MTYVRPVPRDEDMDYVFSQFQKNKAFTFLPIVDADDRPAGIIREFDFKEYIYGMFGRELIRKESVERFSSDR